ncbi:MAG: hypothetical protein IKO19_10245, partial [Candidatus Riflebacteria bacterium]|nr:hypothetical protein [Candidatus Riflebacteria bacterium]
VEIGNDGKVKIILNGATVTSLKFTMNSTSSSYGCVKGKIKLSDDFAGMIDADSDLSYIDRYLVRLIGSSTTETYYSTQTRADFKCSSDQDQNEVDYSFDNIPEGTYSVFVDPAGNGFFGSVGNVVVTAGNTTNVEDVITVTFVKPVFTANLSSDIVNIIEVYPFMLDNSEATEPSSSISITARNISSEMNMTTSTEYITGSKFDYQLMTGNGVIPQKLEISITKSWEDNTATGLRGALTGTYIVENQVDTTDTIGSFIVTRAMGTGIEVAGATATEIDIDTDIIKYSDNSISCIEAYNNQYYYYKNNTTMGTNFTSVRVSSEITEGSLLQDSIGQYAVYNDSDSEAAANYSEKLCFLDGGNESNTPIVIDRYSDNNNIAYYQYRSVSIAKNLTDKYVAYCLYKVTTAGGGGDSLIKLINLSNPNNKIDIATFDNGDYSPNYVRLSLSKDGTPYLLVLLQRSPDHYATIHIYNCSNPSSPIVDCDLDIKLEKVSDFRVLEDGSFYVEINDSCFDDYTPEGSYSNSFRFLANFNDPVEDSCLANRKYCFMDKQGFMYRLDKANKAIIKTTSLDGQPIETYKGFTGEINEGGPVYNPVNGIVGVKEDGSTLYIW